MNFIKSLFKFLVSEQDQEKPGKNPAIISEPTPQNQFLVAVYHHPPFSEEKKFTTFSRLIDFNISKSIKKYDDFPFRKQIEKMRFALDTLANFLDALE